MFPSALGLGLGLGLVPWRSGIFIIVKWFNAKQSVFHLTLCSESIGKVNLLTLQRQHRSVLLSVGKIMDLDMDEKPDPPSAVSAPALVKEFLTD